MDEAIEGSDWTDVGKEAQLLAHGQQALLGTHLGVGVIVELRVTHAGKEHGVGLHTGLESLFGERIAHLVDGICSTDGILVTQLMTELLAHSLGHCQALLHNLWSDAITWQYS